MKNTKVRATTAPATPSLVAERDGLVLKDIKRMGTREMTYDKVTKIHTFFWKNEQFTFGKGILKCENAVLFNDFVTTLTKVAKDAETLKSINDSIKVLNANIRSEKLRIAVANGEESFKMSMLSIKQKAEYKKGAKTAKIHELKILKEIV